MNIVLPTKPIAANTGNARRMLIAAHTKTGKTSNFSELKNSLLLDLEDGSSFVTGTKMNIKALVNEHNNKTGENLSYLDGLILSPLAA